MSTSRTRLLEIERLAGLTLAEAKAGIAEIDADVPPPPPPPPPPPNLPKAASLKLLYKHGGEPKPTNDGNVAVLLQPGKTSYDEVFLVSASGSEALRFTGYSNPDWGTFRGRRPGASYGGRGSIYARHVPSMSNWVWDIPDLSRRHENVIPRFVESGPITPPPPVPDPSSTVLPIACGGWTESRSADALKRYPGRYINAVTDLNQRHGGLAINVPILHELYAPWNAPYSMTQVQNFLALCEKLNFARVLQYDCEGAGYFTRGHYRMVSTTVRRAGWKLCGAPKISLDLTGNYMVDAPTYDGTLRLLSELNDALAIWGYGSAQSHLDAATRIKKVFPGQIIHIHDTFRNDKSKGYYGQIYGETLAQEAARLRRAFQAFQAWGETDPSTFPRIGAWYS